MYSIRQVLHKDELSRIPKTFSQYKYSYIRTIKKDNIEKHFLADLLIGFNIGIEYFIVEEKNKIIGFFSLEKNEWDSDFFKKKFTVLKILNSNPTTLLF